MTPEDFDRKVWGQDRKFSNWGRAIDNYVATHPEYAPQRRKYKRFMDREWSSFMNNWLEEYPILRKSKDLKRIDLWYGSLVDHVDYASTLGYPKSITTIGAEMTSLIHDPEYAKFRSLCGITILVDDGNRNPTLCAYVNVRDSSGEEKQYSRCVALTPLVEMIADRVRMYHDHLHGVPEEITGIRSKLKKVGKFAAGAALFGPVGGAAALMIKRRKKARRKHAPSYGPSHSEYRQDDPEYFTDQERMADEYPQEPLAPQGPQYPEQGPQPGYQPQGQTLADMRQQDPTLVAQRAQQEYYWNQAQANIPAPSYGPSMPAYPTYGEEQWGMPPGGDYIDAPENLLPLGVDPLQVQGWYDNIVSTARHLAESKAVKNLYSDLKKVAKSKTVQTIALSAVIGPVGAKIAIELGYKAHALVVAAKAGDQMAIDKLAALNQAAEAGNIKAQLAIDTARNINDKINEKAQDQVSGWWYNRPYRTNLQVLTSDFPGLGVALRQGWHDGLAFAATMKRKPLFSLGI